MMYYLDVLNPDRYYIMNLSTIYHVGLLFMMSCRQIFNGEHGTFRFKDNGTLIFKLENKRNTNRPAN